MQTPLLTSRRPKAAPAFTLLEVMISITIILVLTGIVLLSGRLTSDSRKRTQANQQLSMIAAAIDAYGEFWPKWDLKGDVLSDQGWPDYLPGQLVEVPTFNSRPGFNDDVLFDRNDLDIPITEIGGNGNDALNANLCLTYSLTSESGKGPYIKPDDETLLMALNSETLARQFHEIGAGDVHVPVAITNPSLPSRVGYAASLHAQVLVNPWGTPYRYFWVYRDANGYKGYLPVTVGDPSLANFRKAEGFVLESAGPDREFGNLWQNKTLITGPSDPAVLDAEDNLIKIP